MRITLNKGGRANCHPASPPGARRQFGLAIPARLCLPAAVIRVQHLIIFAPALLALLAAGCASDRDAQLKDQTQSIRRGAFLLSVTNAEPGSTYEAGVYVIARGDTLAKIAQKFHVSIQDLRAVNPGLDPTRLVVGQKVRIYERRIK